MNHARDNHLSNTQPSSQSSRSIKLRLRRRLISSRPTVGLRNNRQRPAINFRHLGSLTELMNHDFRYYTHSISLISRANRSSSRSTNVATPVKNRRTTRNQRRMTIPIIVRPHHRNLSLKHIQRRTRIITRPLRRTTNRHSQPLRYMRHQNLTSLMTSNNRRPISTRRLLHTNIRRRRITHTMNILHLT